MGLKTLGNKFMTARLQMNKYYSSNLAVFILSKNERKDCMRIFSVDKLVFNAVQAYKAGEYQTAEVVLNQALKCDHKDFAANLWKVRTLVMLGRYAEGIKSVDAYSNKKLHTKLAELLLKWKTFCLTKVQSNGAEEKDLVQMNQETDEMLETYQHQRDFSFLDIIVVVGLLLMIAFLVGRFHMSSGVRLNVVSVIYAVAVVYYYAFKAILPLTIYEVGGYILKKLTQLYHSSLIRTQIIFIFLMSFFLELHSPSHHLTGQLMTSTMLVGTVLIFPIFEEIVMRGFLYGYLKKYNRWIAWIIVTFAFYAWHTEDANSWHIILSGICLYVYDCEGTILAPITIHILNNVINIGLYIGFKNLM